MSTEVTGRVEILLPDGGAQVLQVEGRAGAPVLAEVTGTVAVSTLPLVSATIVLPDGGVQILQVEGRGGGPLVAEVTGPNGAPVDVTGSTVGLNESATTALRTPPPCTVGPTSRFTVPNSVLTYAVTRNTDGGSYGFGRRTQILVQNVDDKDSLSCGVGRLDAGTTPSCSSPGWGNTLLSGGGSATYEVNENFEVWCLGCGGAANTEVTEARCEP